MDSKIRVSFITVNYNQAQMTLELIDSIYQYATIPFEVIVVDNQSKINPTEIITRKYPEVKVIVSGVNRGFAGGNNIGIQACTGSHLFFINNDAVLTEGALKSLLKTFEEHPKAGVVCPLICYYPEKNAVTDIIQYAGATNVHPFTGRNRILGEREIDQRQYRQSKPTFYAHGAAMIVTREVIEKVGVMSENYFLYYEELDWSERIRKAGYSIIIQPLAKIYHKESVSVGSTNPMKTYYLTRNRILFMAMNRRKEFILFALFLLFFAIPKNVLFYLFKGQMAHLRAFCRGIFWHFQKEQPAMAH